jgi:RsiW-degrading membrane proteinase PrsW (M82 family)
MQAIFSLVFSVIPMLLYLRGIWLLDRYDREPLTLLSANFLWGAFGAVFFAVLFSTALSGIFDSSTWSDAVIVAPVVEEPMKAVFLLWTVRDRRFDNITDGLVYGMTIGLGFGMTENFLYFLGAETTGEWIGMVLIRTLFSAVLHAVATGMTGLFIGWGKFRPAIVRVPAGAVGLGLAIWMHMTWNGSVIDGTLPGFLTGIAFIIAAMALLLVLMQVALGSESRLIRRELAAEVGAGRIPAEHLQYLPYSGRRKRQGWLPASVDQKAYVQLATRLAFRRAQARRCPAAQRADYEREVEESRAGIDTLLETERSGPWAGLY